LKFVDQFEQKGKENIISCKTAFNDLAIRFNNADSLRMKQIYSYFSQSSFYIPEFERNFLFKSKEEEQYVVLLSKYLQIHEMFLDQFESRMISLLKQQKCPINQRFLLFENTDNFARNFLFTIRNGKVFNCGDKLMMLVCCKTPKVVEFAQRDAVGIIAEFITNSFFSPELKMYNKSCINLSKLFF